MTVKSRLIGQSQTFPGLSMTANPVDMTFPTSIPSSPAVTQNSTTRQMNASSSRLRARPIPSSSFNAAVFEISPPPTFQPTFSSPSVGSLPTFSPAPSIVPALSFAPLQPTHHIAMTQQPSKAQTLTGGANYDLALSPQAPAQPNRPNPAPSFAYPSPIKSTYPIPPAPQTTYAPAPPALPAMRPPPGWSSGLMQPSVAPKPASGGRSTSKQSWDDFDPLK